MTELAERLLKHLESDNGHQPTKELCPALGCDRRVLQKAREELEEDYPVLSDQAGYWYCSDAAEYYAVLEHDQSELKAAARRKAKRRHCMRKNFPEYQPSLFEEIA